MAFVEFLDDRELLFEVDVVAGEGIGEVDVMKLAVLLELFPVVISPGAEDGALKLHKPGLPKIDRFWKCGSYVYLSLGNRG